MKKAFLDGALFSMISVPDGTGDIERTIKRVLSMISVPDGTMIYLRYDIALRAVIYAFGI